MIGVLDKALLNDDPDDWKKHGKGLKREWMEYMRKIWSESTNKLTDLVD